MGEPTKQNNYISEYLVAAALTRDMSNRLIRVMFKLLVQD